MKDLDKKELKDINGGLGGSMYFVRGFGLWALGEYHDIKRGCQDALDEWVN